MKVFMLVNPSAGGGRAVRAADEAGQILDGQGVDYDREESLSAMGQTTFERLRSISLNVFDGTKRNSPLASFLEIVTSTEKTMVALFTLTKGRTVLARPGGLSYCQLRFNESTQEKPVLLCRSAF